MTIAELYRLLCNLVRTGVVAEVDLTTQRCRVTSGQLSTTWLPWLTHRAGRSRTWWAPSVGEQVVLLAIGGELSTAFVLPALYSDASPAPSASADAWHVAFPDGAIIEYEPDTGALSATGVKSAAIKASDSISAESQQVTVKASVKIMLDTPEVECSNHLSAKTFSVTEGGRMSGDITHSGGTFSSNGIVVDDHKHGGVQTGGGQTGKPV
ncbi:phage baseplate assembly protein V [Serratia marcescens]|uniref:Phage baseplate assembly protein V n=1 Tax=Serratia marcescens TaxID=615 RepID=A0A1C3HKN2_SERMA|nr:phage baseplate assembly protein V [Serratia marcescens]MDE5260656.1 phage baseplate assembly protein V [Serratia marcescens]MDQ9407400.1 phage baseplate assembly protein V [Serratia marcescens]MDQ9415442.1 phage baseplate assembly protein V [Serratia marcescens]MDQ9424919.1 phage baseplate assembly protein V [Serratia marcescens]MDQ9431599.1 phage baseplate assembly protein V [Serratia marcescens]